MASPAEGSDIFRPRPFPVLPAVFTAVWLPLAASAAIFISAGSVAMHQLGKELSGITWAGGNRYYAVEDKEGALYPLAIDVTPDGAISCSVGTPVSLAGAGDLEGCAWDPAAGTVWVSMESSSTPVREYDPATGELLRTAPVPSIMVSHRRGNFGLEALTISGDGLAMWTCNEEALTCDGDCSTTSAGTVVRLVRFTRASVRDDWVVGGQWAYRTDPLRDSAARFSSPRSGVSALCALPDGSLLALEREFSGSSIRIRIYQVDFTGADDISPLDGLAGQRYTGVSKTMLYEFTGNWAFLGGNLANYEGLCLGPRTGDGTAALVMVADGGHLGLANVRHLRLSGLEIRTMYFVGPDGCGPSGGPYRFAVGDENFGRR